MPNFKREDEWSAHRRTRTRCARRLHAKLLGQSEWVQYSLNKEETDRIMRVIEAAYTAGWMAGVRRVAKRLGVNLKKGGR